MKAFFRVLIPSWRFFAKIGPLPFLQYRVISDTDSAWTDLSFKASRGLLELAFNPEGNLRLAEYGAIERLVEDLDDASDDSIQKISGSVSYQLVEKLVRQQLQSENAKGTFEFRIRALHHGTTEDIMISSEHEV